jgi:hypothetical protein
MPVYCCSVMWDDILWRHSQWNVPLNEWLLYNLPILSNSLHTARENAKATRHMKGEATNTSESQSVSWKQSRRRYCEIRKQKILRIPKIKAHSQQIGYGRILLAAYTVLHFLDYVFNLKIEAISSSETFVNFYQTTVCHIHNVIPFRRWHAVA